MQIANETPHPRPGQPQVSVDAMRYADKTCGLFFNRFRTGSLVIPVRGVAWTQQGSRLHAVSRFPDTSYGIEVD